jgi:DNA-binding NarL/FixJ family response regulator
VNQANPSRKNRGGDGGFWTLIADNHLATRYGIKQLLGEEFRGISFGEAGTKSEVLEALEKRVWQAVTLELNIPGTRGLDMLQEILRQQCQARVLVLTAYPESRYARKALSLGAFGYLTKDRPRVEFVKAFRQVLEGTNSTGPAQASGLIVIPAHETLSAQEFKVMLAMNAGKRPGEIASELNLSIKTVSTYKRRIFNKMQLENSADLVRYAIDHHLF